MDPKRLVELRESSETWFAEAFPQGAFDPSRQPVLDIFPFVNITQVQAAVAPDCSYRLLKSAIDAAQQEICLYIYNVSANHLVDLLREAKERNVRIRIMYDVNDTRDDERDKLQALDVELKEAPSSNGRKVFTVCHQKFVVVDESILFLGSANWAGTAFPKLLVPGTFRKGNREWLVRIDEPALAKWFKSLFEADWNIPEVEVPLELIEAELPVGALFMPAILPEAPDRIFDIKKVQLVLPAKVTPIISPNNYFDMVRKLIQEATNSIDIEQQYILGGGERVEQILSELAQRKDELQIRIIVSPAFRKRGKKDNWELTMETLDLFGLKDCLRAMNLEIFIHLHNKGVIIDRQKVIVSSTNWSENSLSRAREAGVLIESAEVAGYFAEVFDFDWSVALNPAIVVEEIAALFREAAFIPGGFEEIHPADLV